MWFVAYIFHFSAEEIGNFDMKELMFWVSGANHIADKNK
jgi:hypothetical protein